MPDDPDSWRAAFAKLNKFAPGVPGFRDNWPEIHAAALTFLADHADRAHALGWTDLDLFGVHPEVGAARVDCCGALMMGAGGAITEVTAAEIRSGATTYRKTPGGQRVLVWEWGKDRKPK